MPMEPKSSLSNGKIFNKRAGRDRRALADRRRSYQIDFFRNNGNENRRVLSRQRRMPVEKRDEWVRVNMWKSVFVGRKSS